MNLAPDDDENSRLERGPLMSARHSRLLRSALLCLGALSGPACYVPWSNTPASGASELAVPYHWQESDQYCGEATVQMWANYRGQFPVQPEIEWWAYSNYPWEVGAGGGLSQQVVSAAVTHYTGVPTNVVYYVDAERRIAVADQQKNLVNGHPTIVLTRSGYHYVILKGGYWHRLATDQPNADWMKFHDSEWAPNIVDTAEYWMQVRMNKCLNHGCVVNIQASSKYAAQAELAEFDQYGGTYYGDPAPPTSGRWKDDGAGGCYWDPNDFGSDQCSPSSQPSGRWKLDGYGGCYWDPNDSGPDQCAPARATARLGWLPAVPRLLARLLRWPSALASRGWTGNQSAPLRQGTTKPSGAAYRVRGPRHEVFVPHPQAADAVSIVANFRAGIRQARVDTIPGWEELSLDSDRVRVVGVERAESLSAHPSYYLVTLRTTAGEPYALAAVNDEGWLMSVSVVEGHDVPMPKSPAWALGVLRSRLGIIGTSARRIHLDTDFSPGPAPFRSSFAVSAAGQTYYVDDVAHVAVQDDRGDRAIRFREGSRKARILTP